METWSCQLWKRTPAYSPFWGEIILWSSGCSFLWSKQCYTYEAPLSPQGFHATSRSSSNSSKRSPWMKGNGRRGGYIPRMLNFDEFWNNKKYCRKNEKSRNMQSKCQGNTLLLCFCFAHTSNFVRYWHNQSGCLLK